MRCKTRLLLTLTIRSLGTPAGAGVNVTLGIAAAVSRPVALVTAALVAGVGNLADDAVTFYKQQEFMLRTRNQECCVLRSSYYKR